MQDASVSPSKEGREACRARWEPAQVLTLVPRALSAGDTHSIQWHPSLFLHSTLPRSHRAFTRRDSRRHCRSSSRGWWRSGDGLIWSRNLKRTQPRARDTGVQLLSGTRDHMGGGQLGSGPDRRPHEYVQSQERTPGNAGSSVVKHEGRPM